MDKLAPKLIRRAKKKDYIAIVIDPIYKVIRVDENDLVYRTIDGKFNAVADDIAARHAKGQPCLIGTVSIESSEKLSRLLDKRGIKHETLNAKNHEREAHIIAQAGRVGAVTIATNMAGRGTDILLGGNLDVLAYLDPDISVTVIENGKAVKKEKPQPPKRLVNIVRCKNPRCISSIEEECDQIFELSSNGKYRCIYCEQELQVKPE